MIGGIFRMLSKHLQDLLYVLQGLVNQVLQNTGTIRAELF